MPIVPVSMTQPVNTDFQAEAKALERKRKIAEILMQEGLKGSGEGKMVSGIYVKPSWTQGAAALAKALTGAYQANQTEGEEKKLASRKSEALAQALGGMPTTRTEQVQQPFNMESAGQGGMGEEPIPGLSTTSQQTIRPTMQQNASWLGQLANIGPEAVSMGGTLLAMNQRGEENAEARAARQQQLQEARAARMQELQLRLADARITAQERAALQRELQQERLAMQRELQQSQIDARRDMAGMAASLRQPPAPVAVVGPDGKPVYVDPRQAVGQRPYDKKSGGGLPPTALKIQNELVEEIGIAGSTNADLGAIGGQLATGALDLGPLKNVGSKVKNFLGVSDEKSRNFATLQATLEKLRNDSLRLNKGVQTEGDAQRAWNELLQNINDPAVVTQRITEIQAINKRAAELKKLQLEQTRANFGADPLDVSQFTAPPAAIGTPAPKTGIDALLEKYK